MEDGFCPQLPVIFSPDGTHYAYAGRIGAEYVMIHDGKEIARGPRAAIALNYGPLTLSPTGRQVYWDEMKTDGGCGQWRLMNERLIAPGLPSLPARHGARDLTKIFRTRRSPIPSS